MSSIVKNFLYGWFRFSIVTILFALAVSGCSTRSISDSGYQGGSGYRPQNSANPFYQGELSEFQILGIDTEKKITQEEITRAFDAKQQLTMKKGTSIMLIQSGAMIPDEPMVNALERYYNVSVFSGVPQPQSANDYAMSLRLTAAKGGFEKIVAYWGLLETAQKGLPTKTVSWLPLVGGAIPDEGQEMRIRLKVAVVDVRSGQWDMFSPEPFQDKAVSAHFTRESSDQGQVALLKSKAYEAAAGDLLKRYAK